MARKRFGLQFEGWEELMANLDEVGGTSAMKSGVENALVKSKEYVDEKIEDKMRNSNLPRKGEYSTGKTKASIDKSKNVEWDGMKASIKIGFDMKENGLTSIFLIYGTPKMAPVKGLKSAIYGSKTRKEIASIQEEEITKEIQRIMGG